MENSFEIELESNQQRFQMMHVSKIGRRKILEKFLTINLLNFFRQLRNCGFQSVKKLKFQSQNFQFQFGDFIHLEMMLLSENRCVKNSGFEICSVFHKSTARFRNLFQFGETCDISNLAEQLLKMMHIQKNRCVKNLADAF